MIRSVGGGSSYVCQQRWAGSHLGGGSKRTRGGTDNHVVGPALTPEPSGSPGMATRSVRVSVFWHARAPSWCPVSAAGCVASAEWDWLQHRGFVRGFIGAEELQQPAPLGADPQQEPPQQQPGSFEAEPRQNGLT